MTYRTIPGTRGHRAFAAGCLGLFAVLPPLAAPPAAAAAALPTALAHRTAPHTVPGSQAGGAAAYLEAVRNNPRLLRRFVERMPKGGDLHNHLSGAATTEYLIQLAKEDGLCVDTSTMTALAPPCGPGTRPAADARTDLAFREAIVRAWSMQDFPPGGNGHDHFFDTFGKFGEVTWRHPGKLLAEVADRVAGQNQFYLETMTTPASDGARKLAAEVGWDDDLARLHDKLVAGGRLDSLVTQARQDADNAETEFRTTSHCGTGRARPGCALRVRWISQGSRGSVPEQVFTQLALGMRLAERDSRFVAVNLVQPEDGARALADYSLQMRMVRYLHGVYPGAHVTLHAGELWPGLVKPEDLRSHIKEAVGVAGAERIGHGVDLVHEDDWQDTARTMAAHETAVEVPFTSNAQILGVKGADHPFNTYRRFGVPVVLATDDPGVSRTDITHEYTYATRTYGLTYPVLRDLARASLEYSFLPGQSLWRGNPTRDGYHLVSACAADRPGSAGLRPQCRRLLAGSPKAQVEWQQEAAFLRFERGFRSGR